MYAVYLTTDQKQWCPDDSELKIPTFLVFRDMKPHHLNDVTIANTMYCNLTRDNGLITVQAPIKYQTNLAIQQLLSKGLLERTDDTDFYTITWHGISVLKLLHAML